MIVIALIKGGGNVAKFASVCRESQAVIEKPNFSRLKLTVPRLADFSDIATRKRSHMKYIWLYIELQENHSRSIKSVFRILGKWNPQGRLTLDISVQSPSDSKHHFKNAHFGPDIAHSFESEQPLSSFHDPPHGWVNGTQVYLPPLCSVERLFEDIEFPSDFWQELSKVTAVTRFRWLFEYLVPNALKKMVVFEDFNDKYTAIGQGSRDPAEPVRTADSGVTRALAEAKLVSLTLTSRQLTPDGDLANINDLLQIAAEAAKKMPKLENMELWNGGRALACVFRYQASKNCRPARITWRGNWDLPLEPKLLDANTVIQSHGDAVRVLEFSHQVASRVSLWQIQVENSL
ncbi:uncharacterized protein BDZ99DRAFT_550438, partial [Mytilinidion resinicola]